MRATRLPEKGRGRALRTVWEASAAEVVAYMDIDLSTDLAALLPLVAPLLTGHSDVAIGSRLARTSRVVRGARREVLSRGYNLLLRTTLRARFSDAQCGFKAMRTDCARRLLPLVQDSGWFFDTELLLLAERSGLRIHEVPVDWVDDPDSRVDLTQTVLADLRGRRPHAPRAGHRGAAGHRAPAASSAAAPWSRPFPVCRRGSAGRSCGSRRSASPAPLGYVLLYVLLRGSLGPQGANLAALLVTAVANTSANRRLTFGITGRRHAARSQVEGLVVFGLGLLLTSAALAGLHAAVPDPARARGARGAGQRQPGGDRAPLPRLPGLGLRAPAARRGPAPGQARPPTPEPASSTPNLSAGRVGFGLAGRAHHGGVRRGAISRGGLARPVGELRRAASGQQSRRRAAGTAVRRPRRLSSPTCPGSSTMRSSPSPNS